MHFQQRVHNLQTLNQNPNVTTDLERMETLISDMELVQSNAQIQGDAELERELARLREFGNQGAEKKTSLKKLFPRKKKIFTTFFFAFQKF